MHRTPLQWEMPSFPPLFPKQQSLRSPFPPIPSPPPFSRKEWRKKERKSIFLVGVFSGEGKRGRAPSLFHSFPPSPPPFFRQTSVKRGEWGDGEKRKERKRGREVSLFLHSNSGGLGRKNHLPSTSPSSSFSGDCKVVMRGRKGGGGGKLGRGENPVEKKELSILNTFSTIFRATKAHTV